MRSGQRDYVATAHKLSLHHISLIVSMKLFPRMLSHSYAGLSLGARDSQIGGAVLCEVSSQRAG